MLKALYVDSFENHLDQKVDQMIGQTIFFSSGSLNLTHKSAFSKSRALSI
jgi:hypothetical protein